MKSKKANDKIKHRQINNVNTAENHNICDTVDEVGNERLKNSRVGGKMNLYREKVAEEKRTCQKQRTIKQSKQNEGAANV